MSIYRHFKGGLYFLEGYATRFSKEIYDDKNIDVKVVAIAKYEETLEDVEVVLVYDKKVGATFYAYKSETISGVMAFYRGLDGRYWLRPKDKFHENVVVKDEEIGDTYEVPRFEKIDGEYLFDVISDKSYSI